MEIRKLKNEGVDEFRKQLGELRSGMRQELDIAFLSDEKLSEDFSKRIEIEMKEFNNKNDITQYLVEKLTLKENKDLYYSVGLWTWLTAFYFNIICPINSSGKRKINEDAKYILTEPKNWRRYYRHLLACPARLYCELDHLAAPFLASPIHIWGDFHEQLTAYQDIATNKPLIKTANELYWDSNLHKLKKGSGSKGSGTPRRFSDVVGQFELTYDLNAMQSAQILGLLPEYEFKKWSKI
jgi:hypothetical protein